MAAYYKRLIGDVDRKIVLSAAAFLGDGGEE